MLANIQALRALAAIFVMLAHVGSLSAYHAYFPKIDFLHHGIFGVDLFFVISGFIMVYITSERWSGVGSFLAARALRIYPLWWLCLLVLAPEIIPYLLGKPDGWYYVASFFLVPAPIGSGELYPPIVQGWTLSYELMFYLVFGLLMLTGRRYIAAKVAITLLALFGAGFLSSGTPHKFFTNAIFLEFAFGVAIGEAFVSNRLRLWYVVPLSIAAAVGWYFKQPIVEDFRLLYYGAPAAALVIVALLAERANIVAPKPIEFLGDASYSLYLSHVTVIMAVAPWLAWAPFYMAFPIVICAALAVSALLYLGFERPIHQASRWFYRTRLARILP
jgi:peptidoglycan/LPS O-acetylase OafA/YrhL